MREEITLSKDDLHITFSLTLSKFILLMLFPSLTSSYRTLYLDEPSLCSPLNFKKTINLHRNNSPAVIVRLTRYKAANPLFHKCHLEFDAPKGYGVIAVVEEAKLRLTNVGTCHDYVQFGRDDDGRVSNEICGTWNFQPLTSPTVLATISEEQKNLSNKVLETPFALQENGRNTTMFYDPGGELHTWFHRGLSEAGPDTTAIKIVISIYRKGCRSQEQNFFRCPGSFDPSICIPREFLCDGHVNCGNGTQNDEASCTVEAQRIPSPVLSVTQIMIGMAVVFLMILVTGFLFWGCCCRLSRRRALRRESTRPRGSSVTTSNQSAPLNPTAPVDLEMCVRILPAQLAKEPSLDRAHLDLPPSYEELFPEAREGNSAVRQ